MVSRRFLPAVEELRSETRVTIIKISPKLNYDIPLAAARVSLLTKVITNSKSSHKQTIPANSGYM